MIGDKGVKALVESLKDSHSLISLSLGKLKYKVLECNLIAAEGAREIGELIKNCKTLSELYLSNLLITQKVKIILEMLEQKHWLMQ